MTVFVILSVSAYDCDDAAVTVSVPVSAVVTTVSRYGMRSDVTLAAE